MADFVNTIDLLGDEFVAGKFVDRTITEFNDDAIASIGDYAFRNCTKLTSVDLPSATRIGENAFEGCNALTSVDLPSVTTVGGYAFRNCKALTSVYLPSATTFGGNEFNGCSALTSIELPKANRISGGMFGNCSKLTTLILRGEQMCPLGFSNVFTGTPFASNGSGGTVYVPSALISQYQNATYWSTLYAGGKCNFVAIEGSEYE